MAKKRSFTRNLHAQQRRDFELSIAIGSISLGAYFLIVGFAGFAEFLKNYFPAVISSMFFVMPFFEVIRYRDYKYIDLVSWTIGIFFLAFYYFISEWTFETATIHYLQVFIGFIILRPFLEVFYINIKKERRIF